MLDNFSIKQEHIISLSINKNTAKQNAAKYLQEQDTFSQ